MAYPKDLKYTKEHEWMRLTGKTATVGITGFAQEQLGDVVYVELPKVGDPVKAGKPFGVVESTKAVSELFSPVDGTVIEVNDPLADAPETLNKDPYEAGWLIKVEVSGAAAGLMDEPAYTAFVAASQH
jgi:glycine cleavage system H protein